MIFCITSIKLYFKGISEIWIGNFMLQLLPDKFQILEQLQ